MEPVRSPRNPRVAEAIRLHRARARSTTGQTLLEGPYLLAEATAAGAPIHTVFVLEGEESSVAAAATAGATVVPVTQQVMDRIAPTRHPRGPVAVTDIPASSEIRHRSVIVAWGVGDPGNVGTLIRTAAAFGLGFIAGPGCADPWSPKVLRAGSGAHYRTEIERAPDLTMSSLRARGMLTVASVVEGGDDPAALRAVGDSALLVGDEAAGLPADAIESAELLITIPMLGGTESLNAAVAGSVLAYELSRRPAGN